MDMGSTMGIIFRTIRNYMRDPMSTLNGHLARLTLTVAHVRYSFP